ncbi:MAG TPA: Tn7-like element transposition protein TnsE [Kangiella sp.]
MQKKFIKKIPVNAKLVGLGNCFRREQPSDFWHFSAYFAQQNAELLTENFDLEALCVMGLGRTFVQNEQLFIPGGYRKSFQLPPVEQWQEARLGSFSRLAKKLSVNREIANQRCFLIQSGDLKVWLPKVELARRLFFHAGFLVRAAYLPNSLDLMFNVSPKPYGAYVIDTLDANGAPVDFIRQPVYRAYLSWLLLNPDIRQSFNSIWQCLNQEQHIANGNCRWVFNFIPPSGLSGLTIDTAGIFNEDKNELLVWEVNSVHGLPNAVSGEVTFSHPKLKEQLRSQGGGAGQSGGTGSRDLLIDTELEPSLDTSRILLDLLSGGLNIKDPIPTKVKYAGELHSGVGRQSSEADEAETAPQTVGTKDDVIGGGGKGAEFDGLPEQDDDTERFKDKFKVFIEIIHQLAEEPGIELLSLVVKPLPEVRRCHLHLMADGSERCYLLAKFMVLGRVKYVLEVDTSDNKRRLSTRTFALIKGTSEDEFIQTLLVSLLKSSLRWSETLFRYHSEKFGRVMHPTAEGINYYKWRVRIITAITNG